MPAFISEPCRGVIYILEPARRGSRKLNASAMPAIVTHDMTALEAGDRPIPYRSVPLPFDEPPKPFSRSRPDDRRSDHHLPSR
jgi:hypothetical protein